MPVINTLRGYRCYCGSEFCGVFQCRFYSSEENMKQEQEEFYQQWSAMEAREEDKGYRE